MKRMYTPARTSAPTLSNCNTEADARDARLSDVLASLSHALDLTEGQPQGHSIACCIMGMRIAKELGLPEGYRSSLYYGLLLKDIGCSSNATETADAFGTDDREVKRTIKTVEWSKSSEAAKYVWSQAAVGRYWWIKLWHALRVASSPKDQREIFRIRCERGAGIASQLGFPSDTAEIIRHLDEHWDGSGHPQGIEGDRIPVGAQIALLAQTLDVFARESGQNAALQVATARSGTWFDPELVRVVKKWKNDPTWWLQCHGRVAASRVVKEEPADLIRRLTDAELDNIAEAYAAVIDAKSPYTATHSAGVARYAKVIAVQMGMDTTDQTHLYRAGLLHDIGKLGVSSRVLNKRARLTSEELREVREHPRATWEILSKVSVFKDVARTASLHHERLDGTGYPWGYDGKQLDQRCRILQVADVYEALTANRPYRGPLSHDEALEIMDKDAGTALDADVVGALSVAVIPTVETLA